MHNAAKLEYSQSIDLTIWRDGKKAAVVKGPYGAGAVSLPAQVLKGEVLSRRPTPQQRQQAMEPLWRLVAQKIAEIGAGAS